MPKICTAVILYNKKHYVSKVFGHRTADLPTSTDIFKSFVNQALADHSRADHTTSFTSSFPEANKGAGII